MTCLRCLIRLLFSLMLLGVVADTTIQAQTCRPQTDVIIMEASVDNSTPYVGEQIIYTVKIQNSTLSSPVPQSPDFEGFWLAGSLAVQTYEEPRCGIMMGVTVTERILFPLESGQFVIPPGTLDFSRNPVYQSRTEIISNEVVVDVRPLPDVAPKSFTGAVGGPFHLTASVGRTSVKVGDPISLSLVVEGAGNIDQLNAPLLEDSADWRVYPQQLQTETASDNRLLVGKKYLNWLLVPNTSGTLNFPSIEFSYFDTRFLEYRTIATQPITVGVLPGDETSVSRLSSENDIRSLENGMLEIKPITSVWMSNRPNTWLWVSLWVIPPAIVLGLLGVRWFALLTETGLRYRQQSLALTKARNRLAMLAKEKGEARYKEIVVAVNSYFMDKGILGEQHLALDYAVLESELGIRGVEEQLIERLFICLDDIDQRRYAPEQDAPSIQTIREFIRILNALDNVI